MQARGVYGRGRVLRWTVAGLGLAVLAACAGGPMIGEPAATQRAYPSASRSAHVDTYHGQQVADPYRWMEQVESPQVQQWVAAQNALAEPALSAIPAHADIQRRLSQLWSFEQFGVPEEAAGRLFYLLRMPGQNQHALYWQASPTAEPQALIDPNKLRADATDSIGSFKPSPDGRFVAWSISEGGTDWRTWRIREVATGNDLPEVLTDIKFTGVSWTPDSRAFYYSRYPRNAAGKADDSKQTLLYRHDIGTPQSADPLVYAVTDHPRRAPYGEVTDDGRYLVIGLFDGYETNGHYVLDLLRPGAEPVRLLDRWDAYYEFLGERAGEFFFRTTRDAPRGAVVAIRLDRPDPSQWRMVAPETADRLDSATFAADSLVLNYLRDARSAVRIVGLDGKLLSEVSLPGIGTATDFVKARTGVSYFGYTDFLTPKSIYRLDAATGNVMPFRKPTVDFDASRYLTEQVFYTSRDGTRVPMFITRRRDLERNGALPTLLYGYGGFDQSMTPAFSPSIAAWLERGGVFAEPNLRGGGEYGQQWHLAGTKLRKQNVFDDFIAAAEWLIAERYTNPGKLAIRGGSNGGLLVGAVMTQRPELFAVALPEVGVLDMLRYHTASMNAYQWSSDYGTVEDAAQFKALLAYSPVHNAKPACYPATLVTTADRDDRVVPWHSFKFGAALQHAQACDRPVFVRIETRAGHGAGKPTWMQIEAAADWMAFTEQGMGIGATR